MFFQNQGQQQQQGQGLFAQPQGQQPQNQGQFAQNANSLGSAQQVNLQQGLGQGQPQQSQGLFGGQTQQQGGQGLFGGQNQQQGNQSMFPGNQQQQGNQSMFGPERGGNMSTMGQHGFNQQGAFSNPLEEMQRMNAKSFLPSFGNDPQSKANKDNSMDTETPDLSDIKKFEFMYKQQPGTIFELSEMNNYKNKKVGELGQSIQDTIFEIDSWIKASRKKLDDLKKANQETKSQLEERLEVALQNNLSSLKNCNLQISTLGRQLSELHKEINYFTMVSDDFERYHEHVKQGTQPQYPIPSPNLTNIVKYVYDRINFLSSIMGELIETVSKNSQSNELNQNSMSTYAQILQELYSYLVDVMNKSTNLTNCIHRCHGLMTNNYNPSDMWYHGPRTNSHSNQETQKNTNLQHLEDLLLK